MKKLLVSVGFLTSLLLASSFSSAEVSAEEYFDIDHSPIQRVLEISRQEGVEARKVFFIPESDSTIVEFPLTVVLDSQGQCFAVSGESLTPCNKAQIEEMLALNDKHLEEAMALGTVLLAVGAGTLTLVPFNLMLMPLPPLIVSVGVVYQNVMNSKANDFERSLRFLERSLRFEYW